jgi:protein-tyrosine kinase
MSRIHDALKQAEQERAANLETEAPDVQTQQEAPASVPSEHSKEHFRSQDAPASRPRTLHASYGSAAGVDGVLAACRITPWNPDSHALLFNRAEQKPLGAEEFRTLRTRLTQMREKLPLQAILVTSALPGEGKTFVAANLAQSFAQQSGRRVLLLDGDLRLSRLHVLFGTSALPGLSDFLRGDVEISNILQRGYPDNLYFVPGGKPPLDPIELLGNGRLKGLLHRLAPLFDWIVLDSPPCVPLSDASLLAELCDGVLMVVKAGKTPFDVAQKGKRQFEQRHLLGVVLNHVAPQAAYSAYYYQAFETQGKGNEKGMISSGSSF